MPGVELFLEPEKEYRFVFVLRGEGLDGHVSDTDPQAVGKNAHIAEAQKPEAEKMAELVREFVRQGNEILKNEHPANSFVLRGFAGMPKWPKFNDIWGGLNSVAIAMYPMYRGVAKVVGMTVLPPAESMSEEIDMLENTGMNTISSLCTSRRLTVMAKMAILMERLASLRKLMP